MAKRFNHLFSLILSGMALAPGARAQAAVEASAPAEGRESPGVDPLLPAQAPNAPAPAPADTPEPAPAVAAPPAPAPPPADSPAATSPAEVTTPPREARKKPSSLFVLESEDGDSKLELHGLVHADARFFLPRTGIDTFAIRRARVTLDAKLFRYFELRVQPDFAGSRIQLLDAYANLRLIDEAQLRLGKGKAPVGFERLKSPADIMFAERGFPTLLVPNRDIGVQLHGQLWKGTLEYAGGIYNGVPDGQSGDQDENRQKDYVGRVFVRPFVPVGDGALSGLGLGIAGTIGMQEGSLATYRTSGQETFFTPADVARADGMRRLIAPQAAYYFGPVALLGEFVRVKQRLSDGGEGFTQLDAKAWQVQGSLLVGGSQSYQGVTVDHPIDPALNHWGAFELAARFHSIAFDPRVFDSGFADPADSARVARAYTIGGTWHLARRIRALVNYERTTFEGGAPEDGDRDPESLLVTRLQVYF
jgi:phosphate-selective porin OprO/OprP